MLRSMLVVLVLGLVACDEAKDEDTSGDDTSIGQDSGSDSGDTGDSGDTDTGPTDEDHDTYSVEGGDCDDQDPDVHPGATEVWYDGIDQDCNGDDGDQDGDGNAKSGFGGTDCNDEDASIHPGAQEVCDGVDQDCDGAIDEDAAALWFHDGDGDGFGDATDPLAGCTGVAGYVADNTDCDDESAAVNPAAADECDGKDNDCDGFTDEESTTSAWYRDADRDGHGDSDDFIASCYQPAGYVESWRDCDDAEADVNPDAPELCDGVDNDCDGTVDPDDAVGAPTWYADADGDGFGDPAGSSTSCTDPGGVVASAGDCDDADAAVNPDATEACNSLDDDCDGDVDEAGATGEITWYTDGDGDGYGDASTGAPACEGAADQVADDTDCDDADAAISPAATESCDDVDNDCDGDIDEAGSSGETDWYVDTDRDGYGADSTLVTQCDRPRFGVRTGGDCDETDADVNPGADELCDGVDQDCDGSTADEVGAATWFDSAGDATDVSADLAAGTVSSPVVIGDAASADLVLTEGTLQLCDGTWYARVSLSSSATDLTITGLNGAASTELTTASSSGGPTASVVSVTDATLTIDGLTIRDGAGTSGLAGGGVLARVSGSATPSSPTVTLIDAVVTENSTSYGGGIAIYGYAWVDVLDSLVEGNTASATGGGIWMQNYGTFTCEATSLGAAGIVDNTATIAGGLYIGSLYGGTVSTVGCDWGQDSTGDDNADYDIQQNPSSTDKYCYPNASSLATTVACSGGSCTASTDSTCP